jgi:hypothetical protein
MINSFGYPDLSLSIGVRAFGLGSRLQTLASEKVMTPLWVCIDNSEKGGTRSSIGVVRHCIRALSFSKNVWTEDCPTQRGLGGNPTVNAKIALSKLITSASIDKGFPSRQYQSRAEPHFQQDALADEPFVIGSSGSSSKQTVHLSNSGMRCRAQWVWSTNAHSLRIQWILNTQFAPAPPKTDEF